MEAPVLGVGDSVRRFRADVLFKTSRRSAIETKNHVVVVAFPKNHDASDTVDARTIDVNWHQHG